MTTTVSAKDPDVAATYEIDIWEALVRAATRSHAFALNDVARAPRDTGLYYVCQKAGRTSQFYPPKWPTVENEVIRDGSLEWVSKDPANASPPTVDSVLWTLPVALTLDAQSETDHVALATISGGVNGEDYTVTARITPTSGTPKDVSIVIPVRSQ